MSGQNESSTCSDWNLQSMLSKATSLVPLKTSLESYQNSLYTTRKVANKNTSIKSDLDDRRLFTLWMDGI